MVPSYSEDRAHWTHGDTHLQKPHPRRPHGAEAQTKPLTRPQRTGVASILELVCFLVQPLFVVTSSVRVDD